jgi:hypothetical protein
LRSVAAAVEGSAVSNAGGDMAEMAGLLAARALRQAFDRAWQWEPLAGVGGAA